MAHTSPRFHQFPAKSAALSRTSSRCAPYSFTYGNLYKCLYQRNESQDQSTPGTNGAARKGSLPSSSKSTEKNHGEKLTFAIKSCPNELELCPSSTSDLKSGIRTKQVIPEGTWMGPYQGNLMKDSDVTAGMDTSYMWEIYENGKLLHYVDGSDEDISSWMRFIRCARHRGEQNLFAFQYNKEIYYRAFTDIPVGAELLVWYEDTYPQYMGIPLKITDIGLQANNTNCGVIHSEALTQPEAPTQLYRPKQDVGRKNVEGRPRNPAGTKSSNSAFVSPPRGYYNTPTFLVANDYQSTHAWRKRGISERDHCGQQGPVPHRRAIVINRAHDAPDPFCILTRQK